MKFISMLAPIAGLVAAVSAQILTTGTGDVVWTTTTVTAFTTYCPSPTVWAYKNTTYTVTTATTITILNCPCTISYCTPAPTTTYIATPVVIDTTTILPGTTTVIPPPTTQLVGTSSVRSSLGVGPTPTVRPSVVPAAANQLGAGVAGLGFLAGLVGLVL